MSKTKEPTVTEALRAFESMTPEEQSRRYRGLLKLQRQLEARAREDEREIQWWKGRTGVLDDRCREFAAKLGAALRENRTLKETVGLLKAEAANKAAEAVEASQVLEKWRSKERKKEGVKVKEDVGRHKELNAAIQTDLGQRGEKDLAIKVLIQKLWNAQSESAITSTEGTTCECESAKALKALFPRGSGRERAIEEETDPLGAMLVRRKTRRGSRSRSGSLEEREGTVPINADHKSLASSIKTASVTNDTAAHPRSASQASGVLAGMTLRVIEAPPHPHPEMFSKARKERKQALKMKLRATREMVDGLRKENGVLEGILGEGGGAEEVKKAEWRG